MSCLGDFVQSSYGEVCWDVNSPSPAQELNHNLKRLFWESDVVTSRLMFQVTGTKQGNGMSVKEAISCPCGPPDADEGVLEEVTAERA